MKKTKENFETETRSAQILGKAVRKRDASMRQKVLKRDGFKCVICGIDADNAKLQLNHLVKLIDGGEPVLENTITVCPNCNNVREVYEVLALSKKRLDISYHLRRRVDGVMCDTAKSTCIHEIQLQRKSGWTESVVEQLFKTRDDVLFILSFGKKTRIKSHKLRLITENEAKKWLQQDNDTEPLLSLLNKQVTSNLTLRLPTPLRDQLANAAAERDVSLHSLIVETLQDVTGSKNLDKKPKRHLSPRKTRDLEADLVRQLQEHQRIQSNLAAQLEDLLTKDKSDM